MFAVMKLKLSLFWNETLQNVDLRMKKVQNVKQRNQIT